MRFFLAGPGLQCIQPFSQLCVWVASSGWLWQDSFWRSWATFRQLQIGNCQTGTDASTLKPLGQNDTHAISCYDILMNFATCFTPVQWNHFVNKEAIVKCIEQQHFNILSFFLGPQLIELDDGNIYRKALYLMVKTMVSCNFSLKPIQWPTESLWFLWLLCHVMPQHVWPMFLCFCHSRPRAFRTATPNFL